VRGTSAAEHEASLRKLYSVKTVQVSQTVCCDISLAILLAVFGSFGDSVLLLN